MGHIRVRFKIYSGLPCSFLLRFFFWLTGYTFSGQEDYSFGELLPMTVIGVIGGLLGW